MKNKLEKILDEYLEDLKQEAHQLAFRTDLLFEALNDDEQTRDEKVSAAIGFIQGSEDTYSSIHTLVARIGTTDDIIGLLRREAEDENS